MAAFRKRPKSEDPYAPVESLFELSPDGVIGVDTLGEITVANPKAEELFGVHVDEFVGKSVEAVLPGIFGSDILGRRTEYLAEPKRHSMGTGLELFGRRADGSKFPIDIASTPYQVGDEQIVFLFVRDISARRILEDENRRLSDVVRQSPMHIIITDPEGRIEYVNPAFSETTGYSQEDVIGGKPSIWQSGETPGSVYKDLWETILAGNTWRGEIKNKKKDGNLYWESAIVSPSRNREGVITHFVAVKEDISERRQMLLDLVQSEADLNRAQQVGGIGSWKLDVRRGVLDCSAHTYRVFGVAPGTILTLKDFLEFVHPDDVETVKTALNDSLDGTPYELEHRIVVNAGVKWLHVRAEMDLEDGEPVSAVGTVQDITELKEAETGLQELERQKVGFVETSPDAVACWQAEGGIQTDLPVDEQVELLQDVVCVEANRTAWESAGFARKEEFVGMKLRDAVVGTPHLDALERFVQGGYRLDNHEVHLVSSAGRSVVFLVSWQGVIENGELTHVWSGRKDITELKRAEEEIRKERDLANRTVNSMPGVFYLFDSEGRMVRWNENLSRVTGYSGEEIAQMRAHDFIAAESAQQVLEAIQKAMIAGFASVESAFAAKDGSRAPFLFNGSRIDIDGKPHLVGMGVDISERIKAEEALRSSEEKYRLVVDNASDAIVIVQDDLIKFANNQASVILGHPLDRMLLEPVLDFIHPDDREIVQERYQRRLKGDSPQVPNTSRILVRDERTRFVESRTAQITWEGAPAVLSFFNDISERVRVEEELKRAQEIAKIGSWSLDFVEGGLSWSEETYRIFGVDPGEPLSYEYFLEKVYEDDRDSVDKAWNAAVNGAPYDIEHRILLNGEVKWVREQAELVFNKDGAPVKGVGTVQDITERKHLEAEVFDISSRERQRIGQGLHDGIGQHLTGMRLMAGALELRLADKGLEEARDARAMQERITETVEQTRFLARGLVHLQMDQNELTAALEDLAEQARGLFGVECQSTIDPDIQIEDEEVASHLYQIAREATTNAARHARPKSVSIDLASKNRGVVLTVTDDGIGMDQDLGQTPGLGLRIMRYRSSVIGANLDIERRQEGGTVVRCALGMP